MKETKKILMVRVIDGKVKPNVWYHLFQLPTERWIATQKSLTDLGLPVGKRLLKRGNAMWFYWGMIRTTDEGEIDSEIEPEYFDKIRSEMEIILCASETKGDV